MLDKLNLHTLIADPNREMRVLLHSQLVSIGVTDVKEASSSAIALNALHENRFDLALLEYNLGDGADGQQVLEHIRQEGLMARSAVVMLITGEATYGSVAQVAEYTPDGYLLKPFTAESLRSKLLPILQRKQQLKPAYARLDSGDFDGVLMVLGMLEKQEGVKHDTARLRGEVYLARHDFLAAQSHYSALTSKYPWAQMGLARALTGLGHHAEAAEVLAALVQATPMYYAPRDLLAEERFREGRTEEALALLEAAATESPTIARMRRVSQIAEAAGRAEKAVNWLNKVVDNNRYGLLQDPADHARLACLHTDLGMTDKAISLLSSAERTLPKDLINSPVLTAAKVISLKASIDKERASLANTTPSIRERREGLLKDSEARMLALAASLCEQDLAAVPGGSLTILAEALMVSNHADEAKSALGFAIDAGARTDRLQRRGHDALVASARQASSEVFGEKHREGLGLLKDNRYDEAVAVFEQLDSVKLPPAPVLANLIMALVGKIRHAGGGVAELRKARNCMARLRNNYPDYERLPAIEKALAQAEEPPG